MAKRPLATSELQRLARERGLRVSHAADEHVVQSFRVHKATAARFRSTVGEKRLKLVDAVTEAFEDWIAKKTPQK